MNRRVLALVMLVAGSALSYLIPGEPRPAWAMRSQEGIAIKDEAKPLTAAEAKKIQAHLRNVLGIPRIRLEMRSGDADVLIGEKIIGIVYPDEEDGERAFYFEMAVYGSDLDGNVSESKR